MVTFSRTGEYQEFPFQLSETSPNTNDYVGDSDEQSLTAKAADAQFKFRMAGATEWTTITGPVCVWSNDGLCWLGKVLTSLITANTNGMIRIESPTNLFLPTIVLFNVGGGGGGMGTPITYTSFDPVEKTITTGDAGLTKIQIIDIYNMDKHFPLFRTTEERIGKIVSVVDGVITLENPVYLGKCNSVDDLQIIVNQG